LVKISYTLFKTAQVFLTCLD